MENLSIRVNGVQHEIGEEFSDLSLLEYLRDHLGLTGAKNGCGIGSCGACTVLVDDKALRSCVTPLRKVLSKNILTIEGLSLSMKNPHPVQKAFLDKGAVQCGFCTPGMVLKTVELLQNKRGVTREEIRKALRPNLCRCTGYDQIFQAVELADAVWDR